MYKRQVHGWLNFADRDKFRASQGHMIIYNNDRCYLFTGITSIGGDDSAIGFIMVDMVTKDSIVYQMPGATEEACLLYTSALLSYTARTT